MNDILEKIALEFERKADAFDRFAFSKETENEKIEQRNTYKNFALAYRAAAAYVRKQNRGER